MVKNSRNTNKKKILLITEQPEQNLPTVQPYLHAITQCTPFNGCWGNVVHNPVGLALNSNPFGTSSLTLQRLNIIFNWLLALGHTYYWTHWIKCPRQKNRKNIYFNDACANKWIHQEINYFTPDVIFAFGEHATSFVLGRLAGCKIHNHEFTDILWEFIRACLMDRNRRKIMLRNCNSQLQIYFIPLPHPSGANNLSRLFFNKYNELRPEIRNYLLSKKII